MPWAIKKALEHPALRGRQSHGYLAAREARHQIRQEYLRTQAPLNEPVNQTDLDTNSTQTTPLQRNSSNGSTFSASSVTATTDTDTAPAITATAITANH